MSPFVEVFRTAGETSDPGTYREALLGLPDEPRQLCAVIQGLLIHPLWGHRYGVSTDPVRADEEQQARSVVEIIDNVLGRDDAPLSYARPPEKRAFGTCRNFSLILCSALRCKGVPARLRCGFATYFEAEPFEDHWICEYWSEDEKYWVRVDPQLDAVQSEVLGIEFDPCDVPIDAYLYAGEAWTMCRRERAAAEDFGYDGLSGMGFIKGNIVRDILALNKIETLPWDGGWGILGGNYLDEVDRDELGYIDRLARCSANSLVHLAQSFFHDDEKIRFPEGWTLSMAPTITQLRNESHGM